MRILFTGVGRRIELIQAFRSAALVLGKELKIYGADMTGTAPALAYCDYIRRVVGMKDVGYIDQMVKNCEKDRIDLLIPTIDTDLLALAENKERFKAAGTRVLVSEPDKIKICRDKNNIFQFFIDCGLHAPMPVNDWKKYEAGFPAFIKPKDGSSSINAYKVENKKKLEAYAGEVPDYIVQPFIDGREYTIDIFCDWNGEPVSIVPRQRLQVQAGEVLKTQIYMDKRMIEESRLLCKAFKPCGPMTVQLIRDEKGTDWFIEINPRYGGGAPLSMKAGARSAENVLRMIDGEVLDRNQTVSHGAVYSRFNQSVCITEDSCTDLKGVIFDLDDTLYSEKEYIKSGYRAVSDYLGGSYEDKLWRYFGEGKKAFDELLKELGRESELKKVISIYHSHKPNIHLYPNVKQMIKELRNCGIKVGIITDGRPESQRNKILALGLEVDDFIITDELGGIQFRKPCDIAFRILAVKWKLPYEQIIYVGDNPAKDFQAPRQMGLRSVYFSNGNGLYSTSDCQIETIVRITDLLKYVKE